MSGMTAVSTKTGCFGSMCLLMQLPFAKLSTVSVYEGKKCLVKSGKDIVSKGQISAQNTYKKVSKDLFSGRFV